jgi:hypothetical protein
MITPAYSLTATERVLPRMALDFTTGVLDSRVTITRALNTATRINSSGLIEGVNANLPRFDYDPTTLAPKGLLIEETRTNLFLNSLIDGTSLSTQTVAVTAVAHTISFYGTGTITLTGATSATVTGTGVYPNRQTLTFTPIVGALICTVTGSVQYAQIEVGSFATSFIPTAATSLTRNADVVQMTGTNFTSWYNASEGAFVFWGDQNAVAAESGYFAEVRTDNGNRLQMFANNGGGQNQFTVRNGGSIQADFTNSGTITQGTAFKTSFAYKLNSFGLARDGGTVATDTLGTIPSVTDFLIGHSGAASNLQLNGHISKILYYPQRIINAEVQAFSK